MVGTKKKLREASKKLLRKKKGKESFGQKEKRELKQKREWRLMKRGRRIKRAKIGERSKSKKERPYQQKWKKKYNKRGG